MSDLTGTADLRVVVNLEGHRYIAQGVDDDIVAFGASPEAALEAFGHAVIRQCLVARHFGDDPLSHLPSPPAEYAAQWEACANQAEHAVRHFDIPAFSIQPGDAAARPTAPRRGTAMIAA